MIKDMWKRTKYLNNLNTELYIFKINVYGFFVTVKIKKITKIFEILKKAGKTRHIYKNQETPTKFSKKKDLYQEKINFKNFLMKKKYANIRQT